MRVVRAATNERVCGVSGTVVITYARGEGGARSVGVCRAWRTGRALGMFAGELGMVCAYGTGADKVRALDREWQWGVILLPVMLARLGASPSSLSTCGWQGCI